LYKSLKCTRVLTKSRRTLYTRWHARLCVTRPAPSKNDIAAPLHHIITGVV